MKIRKQIAYSIPIKELMLRTCENVKKTANLSIPPRQNSTAQHCYQFLRRYALSRRKREEGKEWADMVGEQKDCCS